MARSRKSAQVDDSGGKVEDRQSDEAQTQGTEVEMSDDSPEKREPRKRVNAEFSLAAYDQLVRLQRETDAATLAEVVRDALRFYDYLHEQSKDGWAIQLVKDGQRKELVVTTFRLGASDGKA